MKRKLMAAALTLGLLLSACTAPASEAAGQSPLPSLEPTESVSLPGDAALTEPGLPQAGEGESLPTGTEATLPAEPAETEPGSPEPVYTEPVIQILPSDVQPPEMEPVQEPLPAPVEGLEILSVGVYDGPFPEDGSDRSVESVAALLVQNTGERCLQYAELYYRIDDREAVFRLSELPAGAKAMVLEANALTAAPFSSFQGQPERNLSVFHDLEEHPELRFSTTGGELTVTNNGSEACGAVDVCYKLRYDPETLLGGIAYHVRVTDLAPGQSKTVPAAHYYEEACEIVSVTVKTD